MKKTCYISCYHVPSGCIWESAEEEWEGDVIEDVKDFLKEVSIRGKYMFLTTEDGEIIIPEKILQESVLSINW